MDLFIYVETKMERKSRKTFMTKTLNQTRGEIFKNSFIAALGLFCFGVGVYISIQANIGVAPWDAFYLGVSNTFGFKYGNISVATSFIILAMDLLLGERIGIGSIFDAIIVGKTVDLLNYIDPLPKQDSFAMGLVYMVVALFIMGFSQYLYMTASLCCGPRDSMLVAFGKRLKQIPIGAVSVMIMLVVLFLGWKLGGPIGVGTIIATLGTGPSMQFAFNTMKFDPLEVKHQDVIASFKVLIKGKL